MGVIKIGLCGKLRSGKSELSRHLIIEHGFTSTAFGHALKHHADQLFAHTPEYNQPFDFGKRKPRRLYQDFGQAMRDIDPQVWIRHVECAISQVEGAAGIVVEDLRQQNEYDWLRANGFTIIRVSAPDVIRRHRAVRAGDLFTATDFEHDTESHVDSFEVDYEVVNDGDVEALYAQVDRIVDEIKAKGSD